MSSDAAEASRPLGGPPATLLEIRGHDPYRIYSDEPTSGGWREMHEPVSGMKYWNHVGLHLTTWSLVELLRLNGLEEFLMLGEWSIFACVPEDKATYEDLDWGLDLYTNDRLEGAPVLRLKRGTLVASAGMPRPGVVELLVPSSENLALSLFAGYRFPKGTGLRVLQRLPTSQHMTDPESTITVTAPMFRVLPETAGGAGLLVTAARDPRSTGLGRLPTGTALFLSIILGTRAQLSRVVDGDYDLWGGWISVLGVDTTPTLERVLPETEDMLTAAKLAAHMKELEELEALQQVPREVPAQLPLPADAPPQTATTSRATPPVRSKVPLETMSQRPTVTGGWRQVMDQVWGRPYFVEPISGGVVWGLNEVLRTGGLDDLLLSRDWEMCVIDPLAAEVMKDPNWSFEVFADPALVGDPLLARAKGDLIVVQHFDASTAICMVLVPPPREGDEPATGYARYRLRDGRPLLRAVLPPAVDGYTAAARAAGAAEPEHDGADPPPGDVLEGPYFATPPGGAAELPVTTGQDIGSDRWARLPQGYCVRTFADVFGLRARLPDLEGGGWVSIFSPNGTAHFWKQPMPPPLLELPDTAVEDLEDAALPIVWPELGVLRPPKEAVVVPQEQPHTFPDLLGRLGGGRALCDWHRMRLLPAGGQVYKSPLTFAQTTLQELLRLKIWKLMVVEANELQVREYADPRSSHLAVLPCCSLVVSEWIAPSQAVRVLLPREPDAEKPLHAWADLGSIEGSLLTLLMPGKEFWIEPKGGHLAEEQQRDPDLAHIMTIILRAEEDPTSAASGYLQRGDAVQLAEVVGRRARVVQTKQVTSEDSVAQGRGWLDICDEAGWSILKARRPGEIHPEEIRRQALKEVPEAVPKAAHRHPSKQRSSKVRMSSKASVAWVSMPGALSLVPLVSAAEESEDAEGADRMSEEELTSAAAAELPALLAQIGELERQSVATRDWREHRDPIWGRRFFVNKWSGQIIHKLANFGVSYPSVRLTLYFSNLSIEILKREVGPAADKRLSDIADSLLAPLAAVADVPEDAMEVQLTEGAGAGTGNPEAEPRSSGSSEADSIMGGSAGRAAAAAEAEERKGFRAVARIRAPGTRVAWASAGLKQAMANAQKFTDQIVVLLCNVPQILSLRIDPHADVELLRAELEEMEIPRTAMCLRPPPQPEPPPPPAIDDDIREMSRNMIFSRPKLLQMPNRLLGPPSGNAQALARGLCEVPEPSLEEVGLWKCFLGDAGAVSLASALSVGCGAKLHTLLLDENRIAAAGATALGAALRNCPLLRELGLARNPLAAGFAALAAGLGPALAVLDASDASLDDGGVRAAAASVPRWPCLKVLRLSGNVAVGKVGLDELVRAAVGAKALRMVDAKGWSPSTASEWPRLSRMLKDAGKDPSLVRL